MCGGGGGVLDDPEALRLPQNCTGEQCSPLHPMLRYVISSLLSPHS